MRKANKKSEMQTLITLDLMTKEQMELEWGVDYMPEGMYKHVSFSYSNRLPTWEELKKVKEEHFGDEFVLQILPKEEKYINVHKYCLHLFQYLGQRTSKNSKTEGHSRATSTVKYGGK